MKKSFVGDILKILMFKKDIKTMQLAREIQVPQQTIQRIVTGETPRPHAASLKPIAEYFNITIEQLKGEVPLPESLVEINNIPTYKPYTKQIPLVEWNNLANYINDENYNSSEQILADEKLSNADFAIKMPDASMSPYFPEKSLLIFSKNKEYKDRSYVLILLGDGNAIFRQILFDGSRRYLKPINPDLKMYKMQLSEENDQVMGVLVECRHSYQDL